MSDGPQSQVSRFRQWFDSVDIQEHEEKVLIILALVISAIVGLSIAAFVAITERLSSAFVSANSLQRVLSPIVGSLVGGWLLFRFFPDARGSGIPQTRIALILHDGFISLRTVLGKFICSSISLGSGVALGREGPSVHVGAGIASVVGRRLGLNSKQVRALIPVGTAAAVAAAFNTPLAAVLFTLEEILADLHARLVGTVVMGAATSWIILRLLLGDEPLFHVPAYELVHPVEFIVYAILGVIGGFASVAFVKLLLWQRSKFLTIPTRWKAIAPAAGGLTVGLLSLLHPGVLGVGYNLVSDALNGRMELKIMLVLFLLKIIATSTCYGSGNAGGVFGPSLFIGAMLGGSVGSLAHMWLPDHTGGAGAYALVGMGAAFAGIVRTPMTSVIMIFEVTRDYTIIVPLMIANLCSYLISKKLQAVPLYEALSHQEGIAMPSAEHLPEPLTVQQATIQGWTNISLSPFVHPDDPLEVALQRMGAAKADTIAVLSRTRAEPIGVLHFTDAIAAYKTPVAIVTASGPSPQLLVTRLASVTVAAVLIVSGLVFWQHSRNSGFADEAYKRGQALLASGQTGEAVAALRGSLALRPENSAVRRALGLALVESGNFDEAVPYLTEAAKTHAQDGAIALGLARIARGKGDSAQALQMYRQALADEWTSGSAAQRRDAELEYASLLADTERKKESVSVLLDAIDRNVDSPAFGARALDTVQQLGSPDQVDSALIILTNHFPADARFWMKLGETRFAADKEPLALEAFQKASEVDPENTDASKAVARVEEVLRIDPTRRNISASDRAERWNLTLQRMVDYDGECLSVEQHEKITRTLRQRAANLAGLDEKMSLAKNLWQSMNASCRTDQIQSHIFKKLGL